jgi:hypothetical protein
MIARERALAGDSDGVDEQIVKREEKAQRAAGGSSTTGLLWMLEIGGEKGLEGGRGGSSTNRGSGRLDLFSGFENVQSRRRINE